MDEQILRSSSSKAARSATLAGARLKQKASPGLGDNQHRRQHQQQQQYHDNNNGNNNGKVKLLITPATADSYGSRQQMDRSATIITTPAIDSQQQQQQPQPMQHQHQQQRSQQNNRQKNYHHYDYYTDSDLTSSLLPTTTQANNNNNYYYYYDNYNTNVGNNYDQNILLFATEHSNPGQRLANGNQQQQQQQQVSRVDKPQLQPQQPFQQHLAHSQLLEQPANRTSGHHHTHHLSSPFAGPLQPYGSPQAGKFINHYPSWRQTQSPTASHYQNYSFHVPLHQLQSSRHHYTNGYSHRPQSRYGFLTPGDRAKLSHRSSFKSRTLAHIPQTVRDDSRQQAKGRRRRWRGRQSDVLDEPYGQAEGRTHGDEELEQEEEEEEINYYDRPSLETRQFMLSEGDLLKVRSVVLDDGPENPFRPGTELSWEAEMMVRLMKRGYPVQELPALVEAAKHVAAAAAAANLGSSHQTQSEGPQEEASVLGNGNGNGRRSTGPREPFQRRQSSHDLSGNVKQIWASSLSRAKSMPRGFSAPANNGDADSIDLLITSIENEMGQLLVDQDSHSLDGAASSLDREKDPLPLAGKPQTPIRETTRRRSSSSSIKPIGADQTALSHQLATGAAGGVATKKTKRTTSSEQQVSAGKGRSKKKLLARSVATTTTNTNKPNGKHNQVVREANNNNMADLRGTKQETIIKKRKTGCCIIQ